jgi:hypothetical protein
VSTIAEIPTESGHPFIEVVTWNSGIAYTLVFNWNTVTLCWVLDIYNADGSTALLMGIPMVTGSDMLEQFGHMPLGATTALTVVSLGPFISPDAVPTFDNFGTDGHVYLVMP